MDTPVAVVVTNSGSSWRKALNCYGTDEQEAYRLLRLALAKLGASPTAGTRAIEHVSIPELRRTATRGRLGDGYLYLFSCETNVFMLDELLPRLLRMLPVTPLHLRVL